MDEFSKTAEAVANELFDIVDEHDRVVGQERRGVVHANGLRHRAVHVIIRNHRGEWLLQKRSMIKDTFPGAWDSSASGHLDAGEDYETCAVRELGEELGVQVSSVGPDILRLDAQPATGQEFVRVYLMQQEGPFVPHTGEISGLRWWTSEALNEAIAATPDAFAEAFRLIWTELSHNGRAH